MSAGPLILELVIVFVAAVLVLHHYGRISKQHLGVTIATLVAWYFSMIIIFILPLDVSSTFYRQCISIAQEEGINSTTIRSTNSVTTDKFEVSDLPTTIVYRNLQKRDNEMTVSPNITTVMDMLTTSAKIYKTEPVLATTNFSTTTALENDTVTTTVAYSFGTTAAYTLPDASPVVTKCKKPWSYVPEHTLPTMWRIVYWTSQLLTWLILPFMQSYVCAGDFSTLGKMKRAMIENAVYYGSYLLIFGVLLIYVAASPNLSLDIVQMKVLVITAANTWGLFLLVLLLGYGLVEVPRRLWDAADHQHSVARTHFHLAKLSTEKQEAAENLEDVLEEVKKTSQNVRYNHPSRKFVNIIISKCPEEFQARLGQGMDDFQDYNADSARQDSSAEKFLVRLHKRVIQAVHTAKRTSIQSHILMNRALHLENIAANQALSYRNWKEEFPTDRKENSFVKTFCTPALKWYWYCMVQAKMRQGVAMCLAVISLMVIWSECTFFNEKPVLSLFAIFINLAKTNYNFFYIELASCLTISYLCICAYYTVFRIKFFNYYYIAGHHQTDESSLLFVGIMLCRLTAPLCLNFLGLIHLDTHITSDTGVETSYTQIMGHLDLISFISDGFNIYFPILVCVLCVATYFNLGQRCLSAIGFQRFIDGCHDDLAADFINDGRQLVNREKRRIQRELNSLQRMEQVNEMTRGGAGLEDRQWRGRKMQSAQIATSAPPRGVKYSANDKIELLDDVEAIDYNSVDDVTPRRHAASSRKWNQPDMTSSGVTGRPPRNLFDDV